MLFRSVDEYRRFLREMFERLNSGRRQRLIGEMAAMKELPERRMEVGQCYGKLLQLYGVHKATIEARKKGLSVMRKQKQDGSIKLVLMGV